MEMPQVYTVQFYMDLETPPFDIVSQIELVTHSQEVFHLQAHLPNIFACSMMSESAFQKLCESGFITKDGQKINVHPVLKNVRGVLVKAPRGVKRHTFTRKIGKFGKVFAFSLKCATDPEDEKFNIWALVVAFHKNISRHISIGGEDAVVAIQKAC